MARTKRTILEAINREDLVTVASTLEIAGLSSLPKDRIVDRLVGSKKVQVSEVLDMFDRGGLKWLCKKLKLDDKGNKKQLLIDRILRWDGTDLSGNNTKADMAKKKKDNGNGDLLVGDYRHQTAKRKNNPPAKIAAEGSVPAVPKAHYSYSPRLSPILRFDPAGQPDKLPELLADAQRRPLTAHEVRALAEALRAQEPWLEWAGKQEEHKKGGFDVDPVALHIHERISAQAILRVAARQDVERSLFADTFSAADEYHKAVQFYRHDIDWTNRLILGDSLQVMSSLARREDLAGKVQMIYMDPPYGIKFASNFQSQVGRRDVKDKESDLTREPEMVRAYRDTWHLGIHSYLSYLRDRLIVAKELLADTGSIFVQISDENVHRVRTILDEVFGVDNFYAEIPFRKTMPLGAKGLAGIYDVLLWYSREKTKAKYRQLYLTKNVGVDSAYTRVEEPSGLRRTMTSAERDDPSLAQNAGRVFAPDKLASSGYTETCFFDIEMDGRVLPPNKKSWRTNQAGMKRLLAAHRVVVPDKAPRFVLYTDDFAAQGLNNFWGDTLGATDMEYVVQTSTTVVQRCMLMTTDPGDLVLDPTCGSGTTAYVAEQWGRRWITVDTSRVALAIARQRLLSAKFDMYRLRGLGPEDKQRNPNGPWLTESNDPHREPKTLACKSVPHVTLKSIAQNQNLDPIFAKHEPILNEKLAACNAALKHVAKELRTKLSSKLLKKQNDGGKKSITDADRRRWLLPPEHRDPKIKWTVDPKFVGWYHWEVPFDTDPDWPTSLSEAVKAYRKAWRIKMDEVNACIAANAEPEELVDQPEKIPGIVRVSGPFTVEAVQPPEMSLGQLSNRKEEPGFDGAPETLNETFVSSSASGIDAKNVNAYLDQMVRYLRMDGVRFPDNKEMVFSRIERLVDGSGIHAEGRWILKSQDDPDPNGTATVAVAFGPQYGPVTAKVVEELIRPAARRYEHLVIAGFNFDGAAQTVIEEARHPKLTIHMAHIRPDVNPGMNGLLKEQPGSQLFTVFGQPRSSVKQHEDGTFTVRMDGVDIYDPVNHTISSAGASKVAAWFIDGDYDGRTFCVTQAFFPNKDAWEKLAKALDNQGAVDSAVFEALSGTESLPFAPGAHKRVAVKVIDPRGNEVMQVHSLS